MPAKCCQCGLVAPDKRLLHPYYPGPGGPPDLYCPACWKKRTDRTEALEAKFAIGLVIALALVAALLPAEHGGALGRLATSIIVIELLGVVLHELGHAVAAKLLGMKVFKFSVGIGRTLFTRRIGETEVEFKLLPFSGYVLSGDQSLSFNRARHMLVTAAGPLTNLALAAIGFAVVGVDWQEATRGIESISFWHLFAGINAIIVAFSIVPIVYPSPDASGRGTPNDGMQLLAALFTRGSVFRHWLAFSVGYQAADRLKRGDHAGAEQIVRDTLIRYPDVAELRAELAEVLARIGRLAEAEAELNAVKQIERLDRETALRADLALARVLLDGGDPDRVQEADRLSLEVYRAVPDDATAHLVRGRALVAAGWVEKGEQLLSRTLDAELPPEFGAECACALAEAALATGDGASAKRYLALARSLDEHCRDLPRLEHRMRGR